MPQNSLQFQIDQIRKDKIIYAVEATAIALSSMLIFMFSNEYFLGEIRDTVNTLAILVGVAYVVYMGIGNFYRLRKIKELEAKLK